MAFESNTTRSKIPPIREREGKIADLEALVDDTVDIKKRSNYQNLPLLAIFKSTQIQVVAYNLVETKKSKRSSSGEKKTGVCQRSIR